MNRKNKNKLKSTHFSSNDEFITKSQFGYDICNSNEPAEPVQENENFHVNNQISNDNNINNINNDININNKISEDITPDGKHGGFLLKTSVNPNIINNNINNININNKNNNPGEKNKHIIKSSFLDNIMEYDNDGVNSYKSDKTNDKLKLENEKLRIENEKLRIENEKLKKRQGTLENDLVFRTKKQIECEKENQNLKDILKALQDKIIELQSREEQKNKNNNLPNKTTKSVFKKSKGKGE